MVFSPGFISFLPTLVLSIWTSQSDQLLSYAEIHPPHKVRARIKVSVLNLQRILNSPDPAISDLSAPFYQMQQYYRVGKLDDCTKKFSHLFNCLTLKTKTASEAEKILEEKEKADAAKHIWIIRTHEEASRHWNMTFGHLDNPNC